MNIFTSKKREMNPFSGITISWSILGEYQPFNELLWQCLGLLSGSFGTLVKKIVKIIYYTTLGHISFISTLRKLEIETFSGSTNQQRLYRKYGPLDVHHLYCKWSLGGSYDPNIEQNYMQFDFWALFKHFHFMKDRNKYVF